MSAIMSKFILPGAVALPFALGVVLGLNSPANAGMPAECETPSQAAAYDTGAIQGRRIVMDTFEAMKKDCAALPQIAAMAKRMAQRDRAAKRKNAKCRTAGALHGVQQALAEITATCKSTKGRK